MARKFSNQMRHLLVMMLVAGISVCCCQARVVLLGSGNGGNCCASEVEEIEVPSCCSAPADDAGNDCPDENTDGDADGTCDCCCFKGTIQKDAGSVGFTAKHIAAVPAAPTFVACAVSTDSRSLPLVTCGQWYQPPTLLRLRCALIV